MDPLRDYFEGIKDAPVPARLLAETPPEAFVRRLTVNLAWATAGLALVLLVSSLPAMPDTMAASVSARELSRRVALRTEAGR